MRHPFPEKVEKARLLNVGSYSSKPGDRFGAFELIGPRGSRLRIIATDGEGDPELPVWEHVSVSIGTHCPSWEEMNWVKELFWENEECVMQIHPPKSQYKNLHPFTLHLWRPKEQQIPLPPRIMV
jgi:hypothetical protein